jgi:hypothetical protein
MLRIGCDRCRRSGQWRVARLIEAHGPDAKLPDVVLQIAGCPRRRAFNDPCGAVYLDLT